MPSRVTVPIDSVDAGPAPLLTDITMPSVMPMSAAAPVPPPSSSHDAESRRRGSATNNPTTAAGPATATKPTAAAPTSIIRNKSRPRDASASRGGRVTFARDTRTGSSNDQKFGEESKARSGADAGSVHRRHGRSSSARDGGDNGNRRSRRTSSQNYQSDRYQQQRGRYEYDDDERDREHKTPSNSNSRSSRSTSSRRTKDTSTTASTRPTSNRLNTTTTSISTTSSTSSSTRKNENVCRNRLESALRDQFDTSFTGSQGLSTLIGRKDMPDTAAAAVTGAVEPAVPVVPSVSATNNLREQENVAPNILAGGRQNRKREVGPNERKYKDRYAKTVDKAIAGHRRDRPDRPLRDYRAMTDVEKANELDKVGSLLARLGIADNFSSGGRSTSSVAAAPSSASASSASGIGINNESAASCSATSQPLLSQRSQSSSKNSLARTAKDDVDDSRTTMGELSSEENMDAGVDDSRTTANSRGVVSRSSSRRGLGDDLDDSRTTMGSPSPQKQSQQQEQHQEKQRQVEITGLPSSGHSANHNSTIDDSRTTMGDGNAGVTNGANDTTACSSTRMDQSSVVFDFGGGDDGDDNDINDGDDSVTAAPRANVNNDGARLARWSDLDTTCESMRTPHNPGPRRRGGTGMKSNNKNDSGDPGPRRRGGTGMKSNNKNDSGEEMADDSDEMIDSPREHEEAEYARSGDVQQTQYQQGITRMEDSHFTCNADAGTVAETQGAISVARPKLLFETQTPQFERGGSNKKGNDDESEEDSFDEDDKRNNDTSHSGDTTAQSRSLLSNNQGSSPNEGFGRTPVNRRTSCSPVEMPRSAIKGHHDIDEDGDCFYRRDVSSQSQSFQSPVVKSSFASSRKRLATTSGKRGADQQRLRIHRDRDGCSNSIPNDADDDDIMGQLDDDDSFGRDCPSEQIDSPSQMHCSSIQSPPSEFEAGTPSFLVGASQSPILQCDDDESMNYEQSMEFRRHQSPPLSNFRAQQQQQSRTRSHGKQSSQVMSSQRRDQIASPSFSQQAPAFSDHSNVGNSPEYSHGPPPMDEDEGKDIIYRASSSGLASPKPDMSIDDDNGISQSDFSPEERRRVKKAARGRGARWRDINLPAREGGGARSRKSIMDDTVESVDCTVLPRRDRNRRERGKEYSRDVAPADIHVKNGESYRLDPLRVRRPVGQKKHDRDQSRRRRRASSVDTPHRRRGRSASRRGISRSSPTLSFPDPLSSFDRRTADKLEVVADWLAEEDLTDEKKKKSDDDDSVGWYSDDDSKSEDEVIGRGIVISCTLPQIFGVALKLFVTNGVKAKSAKKKRSPSPYGSQSRASTSSTLTGGTLIVLRDKEELPHWEQVLRERTCYSVMNHATISSAERKRSKIAGKCAGFQVVLTTYDALKAKESSYALDDIGRAIYDDSGSQGGWMTSRSQSNRQSCEHLSVLHQLTWHRVIFMDVLGRQSYTCKPATARFKATIALNAKSRFIFFEKEKGSKCFLEDSFKESRKQLCAVATTLHLPEEDAAEYIVNTALLDLRDVQETEDHQDNVDKSRHHDISSVEDSDIEDGQQDRYDYESSRCHSDSEILMSPIARRRY